MSRSLRVCFHAPLLWPLWSGGRVAFTGGAEVQQARLARGLAERGLDVTVVSCDYGQASPTSVHGVRVLKSYRLDAGLPGVRFVYPRLARTWAALWASRADVHYVRGASLEAGTAFELSRWTGAAFAFAAAHDADTDASLPLLGNPRDRAWYRRALRGAEAVMTQTTFQQQRLRADFGRDSVVVPNLVIMPETAADAGANGPVVWVATYKPAKRPDWFVHLARALPAHRFVMCGVVPIPPETTAAWQAAQQAARELPNLEVRGYLEQTGVAELLRGASLFVHTSPAEGFPNTLLEAWSHALPSVACVDPDGVAERGRFGRVVRDQAALCDAVSRLLDDPAARREMGLRARAHVASRHAPAAVLDALAGVLEDAARRRGRLRG